MNIHLAPINDDNINQFESKFSSREGASTYQWFGFTNYNSLRKAYEEHGAINSDENTLSIFCDDTLVGRIDFFKKYWGRKSTSFCWEIAIGIFSEYRNRGIGKLAQRMIVDYIFTHYPTCRIQATTDSKNIAEQKCLENIGFTKEGTIRECQWREGEWHDQIIYSILRKEWPS